MAFDYKMGSIMGKDLPIPWDRFCPECGQPLAPLSSEPSESRLTGSWWSWVVVATGLAVMIAAGWRGWSDNQRILMLRAELADIPFARQDALAGGLAEQSLVDTREHLQHDLGVGAGGLLLIALGLGTGVRRGLASGSPDPSRRSDALLWLWDVGETLGISLVRVILLTFGSLIVSALVAGVPPTLALIAAAADRTLDVIIFALR
jgi:hypothetical protein